MPLLILLAEDDPGIRLAVSDYLEMSGYSVIAASDGEEALAYLDKYHPNLLVADIKMPRLDGYELVKQIRLIPQLRLLPVVLLTERNSKEDRIRGYQLGCDNYLPKPFAMDELGAIIRNLLERSQMIQSEYIFSSTENIATPEEKTKQQRFQSSQINLPSLTEREKQVLDLLTRGLSNLEIGQNLHLSHRTIEKYVSNLFRKTETNKRAELIRLALEHNLLD